MKKVAQTRQKQQSNVVAFPHAPAQRELPDRVDLNWFLTGNGDDFVLRHVAEIPGEHYLVTNGTTTWAITKVAS